MTNSHRVEVSGDWNGRNSAGFVRVVEREMLPFYDQDIVLHVPHGNPSQPKADGKFHIWIWSSPTGAKVEEYAPSEMWGFQVEVRKGAFTFSGRGTPISDNKGYFVGELYHDNLYIYHDICHYGSEDELAIFSQILAEVAKDRVTLSPEEREARVREERERKISSARDAFIELCAGKMDGEINQINETIREAQSQIEQYAKRVTEKTRDLYYARQKLSSAEDLSRIAHENAEIEYNSLLELPHVEDVVINPGDHIVEVYTDCIYLEDEGERYEIGKFKIQIFINKGLVRFYNLDRKVSHNGSRWDHPHIQDGRPCTANVQVALPEIIGENKFSVAASICIGSLESVGLEGAASTLYRDILGLFPKAEEVRV